MKKREIILKITLCGPGDVLKEINIAKAVIADWNTKNWEATGVGLRTQHWESDAVPTLSERGQAAINRQLIDESAIVVAILWNRLGTPTGLVESGTQEEIIRAVDRGIPVLIYFSEVEDPKYKYDEDQIQKLAKFKGKLINTGLPFSFKSRAKFREYFQTHLDTTVKKILEAKTKEKNKKKSVKSVVQRASGSTNLQVAGDGNTINFKSGSKKTIVNIDRDSDWITPEEQKIVSDLVKDLAQKSNGKSLSQLIAEKWSRFYNHFGIISYKQLRSEQMSDVQKWYDQQINLTKAQRKISDPQSWRNGKIASIKSNMNKMGISDVAYYPEISKRLKMKKPFTTLTSLSKNDLERVARLVKYDFENWSK